ARERFGRRETAKGRVQLVDVLRRERTDPETQFRRWRDDVRLDAALDASDVEAQTDRKSTRLNSSHRTISYAVFCLKKKNMTISVASLAHAVKLLPAIPAFELQPVKITRPTHPVTLAGQAHAQLTWPTGGALTALVL